MQVYLAPRPREKGVVTVSDLSDRWSDQAKVEIRGADTAQYSQDAQDISGRVSKFLAGCPRYRGSSVTGPAFAETINRLLEEKLILAIRGGPGRESEAAYRLNPEKLGQLRNELIWHWKNWVVLAVALVAGVAAFLVAMASIGK